MDESISSGLTRIDLGVPAADLEFLFQSEEELIRRCMEERGFTYVPTDLESLSGEALPTSTIDIPALHVHSKKKAEERGYGISDFINENYPFDDEPGDHGSIHGANRVHLQQLSQSEQYDWEETLNGNTDIQIKVLESEDPNLLEDENIEVRTIPDGCVISVEDDVYDNISDFLRSTTAVWQDLYNESTSVLYASPAYIEGVQAWSTCILDSGYEYVEPCEAEDAAYEVYNAVFADQPTLILEQATKLEFEVASVDGACVDKVGLSDTINCVLAQATDEILVRYEGELLAYRELMAAAVEQAKELIG